LSACQTSDAWIIAAFAVALCRLLLPQATMAGFFQPCLEAIAAKAKDMLARAGGADTIVLVGGFSASQHAIRYLRNELETLGRQVVAPTYARSAVLEGELSIENRQLLLLLLHKRSWCCTRQDCQQY
jgi:hypothetical protein